MTETLPGAGVPNPLDEAAITAAVDQAVAAIAAAATLEELKAARLAHKGEKPAGLANREIGALPPGPKAEAGKRVGAARGRVNKALADPAGGARGRARRADPRRGGGRRHAAPRPAPGRRAAPAVHAAGAGRRHLRRHGLGDRRGPRGRGRVVQLRRARTSSRTTRRAQMQDTFFVDPPEADLRAAHPHLAGAGALHARARAARSTCSARARCSAPTSSTRRTRRCSTRSRASPSTRASPWRTSRARSTTSSRRCSATGRRPGCGPSYFPFTEPAPSWTCCFVCRGEDRRAAPAAAPAGSSGAAAAWSTATCCAPRASTPTATPASPSAWASSAR